MATNGLALYPASFMWTSKVDHNVYRVQQMQICNSREYYSVWTWACEPCADYEGTTELQQFVGCVSCSDMWIASKEEPDSME